jgi:DNA polymerase-3 subunit epsilon
MPQAAFQVHGLSEEFLRAHPVFAEVVADFLDFVASAPLVAHNAEFDMKFINAELARLGFPAFPAGRAVDTLVLARQKFPGSPATLDALCKRFNIDNSSRTKHGALLDAELLAEVYLELTGGRQVDLALLSEDSRISTAQTPVERRHREARPHQPSEEELAGHSEFVAKISGAIWTR